MKGHLGDALIMDKGGGHNENVKYLEQKFAKSGIMTGTDRYHLS